MTARGTARGLLLVVLGSVVLGSGCAPAGDDQQVVAFCQGATTLADGSALHGLDLTDLEGLAADDPALAAAAGTVAELGAIEAPREVAEQWRTVVEPLGAFLDALRTADRSSPDFPDELRAPTDALAEPEVVAAGEAVDAYVAERC